jgi:hypothetical protein
MRLRLLIAEDTAEETEEQQEITAQVMSILSRKDPEVAKLAVIATNGQGVDQALSFIFDYEETGVYAHPYIGYLVEYRGVDSEPEVCFIC